MKIHKLTVHTHANHREYAQIFANSINEDVTQMQEEERKKQ